MHLSVQLYTLRDHLAHDVEGTLRKVKEIGLDYVEIAGLYGKTPAEWKALLDEIGLQASGSHVGVEGLENDIEGTIADAKTLGYPFVIVPYVGPEYYAEGWDAFGRRLAPLGAKLKEAGLTLCYHNHDFEFRDGDGLAALYGATGTDVLQAEIDAAWVQIGGHDPAEKIRSLAGRVPLVHLKDFDRTKTPQWTPAGQGTLDYDAVLAACQEAKVEFGVIELDESPGDPLDAVAESYRFLSARG